MITKYITTKRIESWGPCGYDYRALVKIYPKRVPITRRVGRELMAADIDVVWGLLHLCTKSQRDQFCQWVVRRAFRSAARAMDSAGLADAARELRRAVRGEVIDFAAARAAAAGAAADAWAVANAPGAAAYAADAAYAVAAWAVANTPAAAAYAARWAAADALVLSYSSLGTQKSVQFRWLCKTLGIPEGVKP